MKCLFTQFRNPTLGDSQKCDFSVSLQAFGICNTKFETLQIFSLMRYQKLCLYHKHFGKQKFNSNDRVIMDYECEIFWKEGFMAYLKVLSQSDWGKLRKPFSG
jgi:hypothetical protein